MDLWKYDIYDSKKSNFPAENWDKDTNWKCTINLNNALIINTKQFEYTSNKNANYYNILLFVYQKGKWHKELQCPGTEGSVEMNILLQNQQD